MVSVRLTWEGVVGYGFERSIVKYIHMMGI